LRDGDTVIALDGSGTEHLVLLIKGERGVTGEILDSCANAAEPRVAVHSFPALLKAKKLELVMQKCTEVGCASITPVSCRYSAAESPSAERVRRFSDIVREAAEQSGRGRLPAMSPALSFRSAVLSAPPRSLVFSRTEPAESAARSETLDAALAGHRAEPIGIFTGPEGGFSGEEIAFAAERGHRVVTLGPRALRAETAAIVAVALVLHLLDAG
jgi:16S rRNA (uracil1498-N3)-methyltransferase